MAATPSVVTEARPVSGKSPCVLPLQLSSIDLNDQVEGDDRAFEIWHEREDSVRKYLLQARTVITKNSWVKEICGIQQRLALPVWRECPVLAAGLDGGLEPFSLAACSVRVREGGPSRGRRLTLPSFSSASWEP